MTDEPTHDNYALISHPSEPKIFMLSHNGTWTLPKLSYSQESEITRAIQEQLGIDATVLGYVYDRYHDPEREDEHRIYALENQSLHWQLPAHGSWVDREVLAALPLALPEHRSAIATWLSELETGAVPTQRLPWMRPGWYATALSWIQQQLDMLGYHMTGPSEQVKVRAWSTVLRIPTTAGTLYFKAVAPYFAYEILLTQTLAQLVPTHVPPILAIENERCWMLMADAGQTLRQVLRNEGNLSRLDELLPQFAHFQMQSVEHTSRLLSIGCPNWRLNKLPGLFEELLADTPTLLIGDPRGISVAEYAQLRQFTPQVQAMCEQLASYNIPQTIHHDDFHGGNILVQGHNYIFFDWSDSAITHPFCSMTIFLRVAQLVWKADTTTLDHLRDTYLRCWTAYEPRDRLLEAFQLAHRLGIVCRTLTWHKVISGLEPAARWEFEDAVPYWLRMFFYNAEPDDIPK